jgi:hypothetical protein
MVLYKTGVSYPDDDGYDDANSYPDDGDGDDAI